LCSATSCARRCFFTGHRVVRAALDGGVVGDDDALAPGDPADAGDDPGPRRVAAVQAVRGERGEFQERARRVEQRVHPVARQQLPALDVAGPRPLRPAQRGGGEPGAQVVDEGAVPRRRGSRGSGDHGGDVNQR
jgi:hypothetical protein